jgi:hypothetical protein
MPTAHTNTNNNSTNTSTHLSLPGSQAPRSRASLTRIVLALASLEVIRKTFVINGLARAA